MTLGKKEIVAIVAVFLALLIVSGVVGYQISQSSDTEEEKENEKNNDDVAGDDNQMQEEEDVNEVDNALGEDDIDTSNDDKDKTAEKTPKPIQAESKNEYAGWKSYYSSIYDITIMYPPSWSITNEQRQGNCEAISKYLKQKCDASIVYESISFENADSNFTFDPGFQGGIAGGGDMTMVKITPMIKGKAYEINGYRYNDTNSFEYLSEIKGFTGSKSDLTGFAVVGYMKSLQEANEFEKIITSIK